MAKKLTFRVVAEYLEDCAMPPAYFVEDDKGQSHAYFPVPRVDLELVRKALLNAEAWIKQVSQRVLAFRKIKLPKQAYSP